MRFVVLLVSCVFAAASASCEKKNPPPPAAATKGAQVAGPAPTATTANAATTVTAPPARPAAPLARSSARAYSGQWLVILSSSKNSGLVPAGLTALQQNAALPSSPARFSSTELKGLMPCYEVVIANALATKEAAAAYAATLRPLGIDHYVKHAGRFVGKQPKLDAYCQAEQAPKQPARCGGLHFVERHAKKTFLKLELDPAAASRVPTPGKARPLDTTFKAWASPLAARTLGDYSVGQRYTLFAAASRAGKGTCTLASFAWLTRGTPHFAYYEEYNQSKKAPAAPGCGAPELFAELDCGGAEGAFALAEGTPAPALFDGATTRDEKLLAAVKAALQAGAAWKTLHAKALAEAKSRNQPLKELVSLRSFTGKDGSVVHLLDVTLMTGEGNNACGAEALRMELVGAAERGAGGALVVRAPLRERTAEVHGVMKLGGDETLAFYEQDGYGRSRITEGGAAPLCEAVIAYCDCGC